MKAKSRKTEITDEALIRTVGMLIEELRCIRKQIATNEAIMVELIGRVCLGHILTPVDYVAVMTEVITGIKPETVEALMKSQVKREMANKE